MKRRWIPIVLCALALYASTLACSLGAQPAAEPTQTAVKAAAATQVPPTATKVPPTLTAVPPTATKVPPTKTPEPPTATATKPKPTATTGVKMGDEMTSPIGGFSFKQLPGYEAMEFFGMVTMVEKGADPNVGPAIIMVGEMKDEPMTLDQFVLDNKGSSSEAKILSEKKIKLAGVDAVLMDVEGTEGGKEVAVRMVMAMVTDRQSFVMMGMSLKTRFKEVTPLFDAVMGSIKFFAPVEPTLELTVEALPTATTQGSTLPGEIRQWAKTAKASSQYGDDSWSASQATGQPNVSLCGDDADAWASSASDGKDWIELTYDQPVTPSAIIVHESYNPGQIVKVEVIDTTGYAWLVYEGTPKVVDTCPSQLQIIISATGYEAKIVKIYVDQSVLGISWAEIDAVELVGVKEGK